jgi:hypothetical protein
MVLKNAPPKLVASSFSSLGIRALRLRGLPGPGRRGPAEESGDTVGAPPPAGREADDGGEADKARRRRALRPQVLRSFVALAPAALAERRQVRGRRRVPDREVLRWMIPRTAWDARSG